MEEKNTNQVGILEKWVPIKGFEQYKISTFGRVVSSKNFLEPLILKPSIDNGYPRVKLIGLNGRKRRETIHRLVAETFLPNPEGKKQVNHKDGNKLNNCVNNLEWVTSSENLKHAHRTGLKSCRHQYRPVVAYMGDVMHIFESIAEGCKKLNVTQPNVTAVCRGRKLSTGGYYWRYI